ncbi:hypothetical protein M3J07_011402 [Ascochyta lentis]
MTPCVEWPWCRRMSCFGRVRRAQSLNVPDLASAVSHNPSRGSWSAFTGLGAFCMVGVVALEVEYDYVWRSAIQKGV